MPSNAEAGVRDTDVYYVQETLDENAKPQTPSDPTFKLYSSVVETTEQEPEASFDERVGVSNVLPVEKNRQQESHEVTVEYDLEQFPTDSSGNVQDAFADFAQRGTDNRIKHSHTYLEVEKKSTILPGSTVHHRYFKEDGHSHPSGSVPDATSKATRIEHYGRGCVPEEGEMELAPEDSAVITNELQYTSHKIRRYQIDQPSGTNLAIKSTSSNDTSGSVHLETADGATSATLTPNGTTLVPTSATTFSSLRVWLDQDLEGDLEVYAYDSASSTAEQLLTVIRGKNSRDGIEGDQGVPLVGSGSWQDESALSDGIPALGSSLTWAGDRAAENVSGTTVSIENEIEENATDSGLVQDIRASTQTIELEATVFGETESPQYFDEYLAGKEAELRFQIEGGDVVVPRGYITDGGSTERESGSAVMQVDVTWSAMQPSGGGNGLQFQANA